MESLSYLIPAAIATHTDGLCNKLPLIARKWGAGTGVRPQRICVYANKSSFLGFQDYAKPRRLLRTTEPEIYVDESPQKIITTLQLDGLQCLYKVRLRTSSIYGSGLSDLNAGILVCVIDENGDSILERMPSITQNDDIVHFQKGSTDEFTFTGPELGSIEAMWISLESGTWRIAGANLTIVTASNDQAEESSKNERVYHTVNYNFDVEDALLGEGGDMAIAELHPCSTTEYTGADLLSVVDASVNQATSLAEKGITKEASMKEYTNLKYSLLLYDAMLVLAGTSFSNFTAGENTTIAFLTGGITGFLYLLLLQRSVDGLSSEEAILAKKESIFERLSGGMKGPLLVLAFAIGIGVLAVKREVPDIVAALTPKEVVVGMLGFLACKVSVVLAAFKPISMGMKDGN